jgi:hypothetical protein
MSVSAHSPSAAARNEAYSARSVGESRLDGSEDELPLYGSEGAFHLNEFEDVSRLGGSEVGSRLGGPRCWDGSRSDETGSDGFHSRAP